nr:hypothetical protein [Tanacetum cinerariifolium]
MAVSNSTISPEHYALWEVIEFGDSYKAPTSTNPADSRTGRTVTPTPEDMQKKKNDKKKNDVKARTTLLLSLPDEHQLRFSKYKTARELWAAILKTFGDIEKDDLNQKFLTSLAPEWLIHTIVWRNRNDLDSMSLDDLYNHLKVYEAEVQKKPNSNPQNMAFICSSKNSNNEDGNTVCVTTATTPFPTGSVKFATISQDTASAFIASQSNSSQIKFEDINQIDEDDMEEMDIKWNMALLSMRADKALRNQERVRKESNRQGSKAEEKSSKALMAIDGVGWDWSYMANEEDHALVADGETPTEFALMANNENKVFDNSLCSKECRKNTESLNNKIDELKNDLYEANVYRHSYKLGIDQLEGRLAEYKEREVKYIETIRSLERDKEYNLRKINKLTSEVETLQEEKDVVDGKLARLLKSSKDLEDIIEGQRSEKVKERVGYNAVPPPAADLYLSPKKYLSWTGLPEFMDDTELELIKKEKEGVDGKLEGFLTASKDLDNLIKSQRSDKNKEGLGYSVVLPPITQIYSSPKKDLSWTGLPEFADDTSQIIVGLHLL